MNPELLKTLQIMLQNTLEVANKTGKFIITQAPDLIRQFYTWSIANDIFWIVVWGFIGLVLITLPRLWREKNIDYIKENPEYYKKIFKNYFLVHRNNEDFGAAVFFTFLGLLTMFLTLAINLYDLLYLIVAPKLYLIEHILSHIHK